MKALPTKGLTRREVEILRQVATGKRSVDIASDMGLSKYTIDNHRKSMLKKSGTSNSMQLVVWAARKGLLG